jgi:hypothetical protein
MESIRPDSTSKDGKTWIMMVKLFFSGLIIHTFDPFFNHWKMKCDSRTKQPSSPAGDRELVKPAPGLSAGKVPM